MGHRAWLEALLAVGVALSALGKAWAGTLPVLAPSTAPVTVSSIIQRFGEYDKTMASFSARFRQATRSPYSKAPQIVEGSIEFLKPHYLRIEHFLPEKQLLVSDGTWLWVWRPKTRQAIQRRFEDWKKSEPLTQGLLQFGRYADIPDKYEVSLSSLSAPGPTGHRDAELTLKPKERSQEFELKIRVSTRDFFPAQTQLKTGELSIESRFEEIELNPPLKKERFRFVPPANAETFKDL